MLDAAKETVKMLGFEEHEALFVGHSDTKHPHIHVIVNRVNPRTGITQEVPNDFHKFSRWAQEYERKWGKILCEQRVENNRRRDAGEYVKYDAEARDKAYAAWRRRRANEAYNTRRAEAGGQFKQHAEQRKKLHLRKEEKIAEARAQVREYYRPDWKELYARQKKELANLKRMQKQAADKIRSAYRDEGFAPPNDRAVRRLYSARNPQPVPGPLRAPKGRRPSAQEKKQARGVTTGTPSGAVRAGDWLRADKENRSGYLREAFELSTLWAIELAQRHKKERAELSADHKNKLAAQLSRIKNEYTQRRTALRDKQKEESRALTERHLEERKDAARERREGRDKEKFLEENRAKRTAAFDLTKEEVQTRKPGGKPKLAELFKRASGAARDAGKGRPTRDPADKQTEFREQAKDATRRPDESKTQENLADKFRKARGDAGQDKQEIFKENAKDAGQDQGRERSRQRKPPGSKPH
jgi:hypothetical protein